MLKLTVDDQPASTGVVLTVEHVKNVISIEVQTAEATVLALPRNVTFTSPIAICRYLARAAVAADPQTRLYGNSILQQAEVDHWLEFSTLTLGCTTEFAEALQYLNQALGPVAYLVGHSLTIADFVTWAALRASEEFRNLVAKQSAPTHVARYYNFLSAQPGFASVANIATVPRDMSSASLSDLSIQRESSSASLYSTGSRKERKEEGKFVELPGAEMGKVIVRFPPEASGYLHIGHAKAALLNQYYQQSFQGKLIMRFDDTNPMKENAEFEKVILDDIGLLGLKPDIYSYTSDHFDTLLSLCERMIREGHAYADDTEPEQMKKEREERVESKNRNNSVEKNLAMWEEMKRGTTLGQTFCIRAKISMQLDNGCMRDPTMYRVRLEPHVRTGTNYKAYPTYDFACPIVDSLENVTHALRTTEYHDRDEQYYWFLDVLGLRKPYIYEYSRLNLQNTVMSKRKLTWFVDQGLVEGWEDPRFPTVRGVMRRGMTVEGLKEFVIAQGSSRSINMMDWDKIWSFNKKVIDPVVPRYTALSNVIPVHVKGAVEEVKQVQKHPKNIEVGLKSVWYGSKVLIEQDDADHFTVGENVTFINWGNLVIKKINRSPDGKTTSVEAELNLDNKDYKKTQKITWLAEVERAPFTAVRCVLFDHLITKGILGKDEDFKQYINKNSRVDTDLIGDPELALLKKGDIIQLQRRGFFICDSPYEPPSRYSGRASPCVLFNIPDGHVKEMPTTGSKHKTAAKESSPAPASQQMSAKEAARSKKGKVAEKSPQDEVAKTGFADDVSPAAKLKAQIDAQGQTVRDLKAAKATKDEVTAQVNVLLALKKQYKELTGSDYVPGAAPPGATPPGATPPAAAPSAPAKKPEATPAPVGKSTEPSSNEAKLKEQIEAQGQTVRHLKTSKAAKDEVTAQVNVLLALKKQYKELTGSDYVPGATPPGAAPSAQVKKPETTPAPAAEPSSDEAKLKEQIEAQGQTVRQLKASGAAKDEVTTQVNVLLALKKQYKELTGKDYVPAPAASTAAPAPGKAKGQKGDDGKKQGSEKAEQVGKKAAAAAGKVEQQSKKDGKEKGKAEETNKDASQEAASREVKKITRLGLEVKKEENFSEWYSQVITKAEMIEYYDVSGCYVLRPWAFGIWERISSWFDAEIKKIGFENCYFPMFVSHNALETEKEHIADFAPEVAWVTRSGSTELAQPIAIRPTSETVMYPSYAKWVQSHRDLPIKLNQWCSVVRWEFKHPQPFLRTREFLWQEGHSAYATYPEAEKEVYYIIDLYEYIYEKLLAIPVIKGKKTQKEKFAGGDYTTTVEVYIPGSGRGIQAATSHHLGQNFSRMFDISFEDPDTHEVRYAHQNSWAITTRSIGIIVMVHGDNKGLVLPPRIAQIQVVLVPCGITAQLGEQEKSSLLACCEKMVASLRQAGLRVNGDYRDNYSPGWKFNHWELKGVPVRVEIGPRDMERGEFVAVRRDTGDKMTFKIDAASDELTKLLENIHDNMFNKAYKQLTDHLSTCYEFSEFCRCLDKSNVILAPFCGDIPCEEKIKALSARDAVSEEGAPAMGAKGLCIPFKQPADIKPTDHCICPDCPNKPQMYTLFGRSY